MLSDQICLIRLIDLICRISCVLTWITVTNSGFPVGWQPHRRGRQQPTWQHFVNFLCQNERIGTLSVARAGCALALDTPLNKDISFWEVTMVQFAMQLRFFLISLFLTQVWPTAERVTEVSRFHPRLTVPVKVMTHAYSSITSGIWCVPNSRNWVLEGEFKQKSVFKAELNFFMYHCVQKKSANCLELVSYKLPGDVLSLIGPTWR